MKLRQVLEYQEMSSCCAGFPFSNKNKMHMHTCSMEYELYNFGDSAYELNAFTFAFNDVMAQ